MGSPDVDWNNVVNELVDPGAFEMVVAAAAAASHFHNRSIANL